MLLLAVALFAFGAPMADAAPNAWFSCSISGFVGSVDVSHSAELKDGQLNVYASDTDEDPSYLYVEDFLNKVSHSEFCELFQVDEEEYDEEVYEEFIFAAANQGVFDDLDMDELFYDRFSDLFCEYFEDNEAEADVIESFRNKLCDLGVESLEEFMFFTDLSDPAKSYTYDPISRITTFGSNSCDEDDDFDEDDEDDDFDEDDEDWSDYLLTVKAAAEHSAAAFL